MPYLYSLALALSTSLSTTAVRALVWEVNLWRDKMKITVDRLVLSASSRLYRYGIGSAPLDYYLHRS